MDIYKFFKFSHPDSISHNGNTPINHEQCIYIKNDSAGSEGTKEFSKTVKIN